MKAEDVVTLYKLFEENGIEAWVDGGWGVDVLLGEQTRPHKDLDIAVHRKDASKLRSLLNSKGYKETKKAGDWNFVLSDDKGREVDIHVFEFDTKGNNVYGINYPKESLTGIGTINAHPVKCISAEWVIKFHANYDPTETGLNDIQVLCKKFGIELPENYKNHPEFYD